MYFEFDDLRQSYVVAENEVRKFVRGRKFALYILLVTAVFLLITILPYIVMDGLGETPGEVIANYALFIYLLVIMAATLFASTAIVSEFEERTALILFTRPIKKTSIFLGKVLGCIFLEMTMIIAFYLGLAAVSFVVAGGVPGSLFVSLGITMLYVVATSGVAILISSVVKKASTAAVFTFFMLLLILQIVYGVLNQSTGTEAWYMLDYVASSISNCIPEFLDLANHVMVSNGLEPNTIPADVPKAVITAVAWSIATYVLAWIAFIRREF